ncbi:MAG: hypothetical protein JSR98_15330 [Proteobacteria bacterium]|nr:hypothetical protein [Pseudomonadota bacterium]
MHPPRSALPVIVLLAASVLSACGGKGPNDSDNPPAPPDVAANFAQPIDAHGADGSWSLKVRDTQLMLSRYGQPDLVVTAPGAMITPHQATWVAALPDKSSMTVKLYASACVFPATQETHAFAAEVDLPDAAPLSGCGDAVAAPKPAAKK